MPSPASPRWLRADATITLLTVTASDASGLPVGVVFMPADGPIWGPGPLPAHLFVYGANTVSILLGGICRLYLDGVGEGVGDTHHSLGELPSGTYAVGGYTITLYAVVTTVFQLGTEDRSALTTEDGTPVDIER